MEEIQEKERAYKIIDRTMPGGRNVGYLIEYGGQEYIADITVRTDKDWRTEFAVFKSVDGQITFENALPLYLKMDVQMNFDSLEKLIDEFIEDLEEEKNHGKKNEETAP